MHFHAEHALFFEERQPVWRAGLILGMTVSVLAVNVGAGSPLLSAGGATVAALLLAIAYTTGQRRLAPALSWMTILIGSAVLGGVVLGDGQANLLEALSRVGCGVLWVLWLGTQVDWASMRRILLVLHVPEGVVSTLDHALMNGILTRQEWGRRRDAARLRIGHTRLSLPVWGRLLGGGALAGFQRLEAMEEAALIRSSPLTDADVGEAIRLDRVDLQRDGVVVLENLNLTVQPGETLLLAGPSGAGKSSLLRLLAGLDAPSEGQLRRLGQELIASTGLCDRLDGRVVLLAQNPEHHFIASTVAEDIAWGLLRRGVDADAAVSRAREMADALGIKHLVGRPCHALSFGEQRRVALAGLLVLEPTLLLLDEPTSGLDPVTAHELCQLVGEIVHQTGATCIWATHDLQTVPDQAKRTILLRDGRVVFDGPSSEALSHPWLVRAGLAVPQSEGTAC